MKSSDHEKVGHLLTLREKLKDLIFRESYSYPNISVFEIMLPADVSEGLRTPVFNAIRSRLSEVVAELRDLGVEIDT